MNPTFPTEILNEIRQGVCRGDGDCLDPNQGYNYSEQRYKVCLKKCKPVQCPNSAVCGEEWYPQWFFYCHGGTCNDCNARFGTWDGGRGGKFTFENVDQETCGICMETPLMFARLPACDHSVCVFCFRKVFQYDPPVTVNAEVPFFIEGISTENAEENISDNITETAAYIRSLDGVPDHLVGKIARLAVLWWHYVDELCSFNEFDNMGTGKGRRCPFCYKTISPYADETTTE